ncbi:hypothetical protein HYS93_02410 [Candidatus Daviesbacteria bacterium]|nr:hypothetical protein [Candidatus Daviesbacteria bacterium]
MSLESQTNRNYPGYVQLIRDLFITRKGLISNLTPTELLAPDKKEAYLQHVIKSPQELGMLADALDEAFRESKQAQLLSDREEAVLRMRYSLDDPALEGRTLSEVAAQTPRLTTTTKRSIGQQGLSVERTRTIIEEALAKIRHYSRQKPIFGFTANTDFYL